MLLQKLILDSRSISDNLVVGHTAAPARKDGLFLPCLPGQQALILQVSFGKTDYVVILLRNQTYGDNFKFPAVFDFAGKFNIAVITRLAVGERNVPVQIFDGICVIDAVFVDKTRNILQVIIGK